MTDHNMIFMEKLEGGWYDFECPACAYHIRMKFDPFKRIVLNQGDFNALHSGGLGPMGMSATIE